MAAELCTLLINCHLCYNIIGKRAGKKFKENEMQTDKGVECFCTGKCEENNVHIENDKVICILNRAVCSEEEWK